MEKQNIVIYIISVSVFLLSVLSAIFFKNNYKEEPIRLNGWPTAKHDSKKQVPSKPVIPEMIFINGGILKKIDKSGKVKKIKIKSFYIGKYEVTNKEYYSLFECQNSGNKLPAVNVTWTDATRYCTWLSDESGLEDCYENNGNINMNKNGYRLPTEEEWEYACQGGSKTKYYWGDEMNRAYCWYIGNSGKEIHEIGKKKPNGYNLYDMIGNASEWCTNIYAKSPMEMKINPEPKLCIEFLLKGGSFVDSEEDCQVFSRMSSTEHYYRDFSGFRLVRIP